MNYVLKNIFFASSLVALFGGSEVSARGLRQDTDKASVTIVSRGHGVPGTRVSNLSVRKGGSPKKISVGSKPTDQVKAQPTPIQQPTVQQLTGRANEDKSPVVKSITVTEEQLVKKPELIADSINAAGNDADIVVVHVTRDESGPILSSEVIIDPTLKQTTGALSDAAASKAPDTHPSAEDFARMMQVEKPQEKKFQTQMSEYFNQLRTRSVERLGQMKVQMGQRLSEGCEWAKAHPGKTVAYVVVGSVMIYGTYKLCKKLYRQLAD